MEDKPNLLHNMSSMSQSVARVEPRFVGPPPTVITGKPVGNNQSVLIEFLADILNIRGDQETVSAKVALIEDQKLWGYVLRGLGEPPPVTAPECQERLREIADQTIRRSQLTGCLLVMDVLPGHFRKSPTIYLPDSRLKLAILAKSSSTICVFQKTPVITRSQLSRWLSTSDPRIIQIAEESNREARKR